MISLVAPAFNEEDGIQELYRRVVEASESWNEDFELIVVDDGSTDRTVAVLEGLAGDSRLKVICLSRNFGHQAAVSAGLLHARGDIVAVIDADLQDPPEILAPFLEKVREGWDVVYAIRAKRKEGWVKRACYYLYYRLLKRMAGIDIPLDAGDFCVMRRDVVDALNRLPERNRFVRGLRTWVGYCQTGLVYERHARYAGEPKYTFRKLFKLAADGVINFSYRPLQMIVFLGVLTACVSILGGFLVIFQYLANWTIWGFNPHQARGWTSLIFVILFSSGVQLICLGILGEYVGRLFEEVKQRPAWLVRRRINLPDDTLPREAPPGRANGVSGC
ncbi:MAG TPA: glycosyltransferase family 2 protein [Verrucomicrobiae bacterium]|nr:glycosyltransferase family 2 protein [Verrucomicrobiae bacterium]